jgi:hypothetical protein
MKNLIVLMALFLSHPGAALAARACAQEERTLCPGVDPGKGQLMRCLSDHEGKLGPACLKELKTFKQRMVAANPCYEDLTRFCQELGGKGPALAVCLLKHETRLSPVCAKDFASKKDKILAKEPCAQDLMNRCYQELSGEPGTANRCLFRHKGKLLARCEVAVAAKMQKIRARNACFDDTEKLCPGTVNRGGIDQCLEGKTSQLTPPCKKQVEQERARVAKDPCRRDLRLLCPARVKPNEAEGCLEAQGQKLSKACQQTREDRKQTAQKMQRACEIDRVKYCALELRKGGRITACLRRNQGRLTKECAEAMPK